MKYKIRSASNGEVFVNNECIINEIENSMDQ